ncbi:hypothetical protein [Acinetobacter soli]|uniref:hypothetical protein n=1 Tax=Acinetobacter soli TaxID=487316 RepID=UPI001D183C85|nr:hypothetical protein [Acinetobacter soli]
MIDLEKEREAFESCVNIGPTLYLQSVDSYEGATKFVGENHVIRAVSGWNAWKKCAESKQAEIDSLKAQLAEYSKAALDVIGERNRQIEQEHYSIEHDDSYQNNELPRAAASYVNNVVSRGWVFSSAYGPKAYQSEEVPDLWPWSDEHWKPKNPRRDLVKAAALIIAEIDRMDRSIAGEQS